MPDCVSVGMNDTNPQQPAAPAPSPRKAQKVNEAGSCEHCGALVYGDNIRCPQCDKFPIKMHKCPRCKSIAAANVAQCWKCGRVFEPNGDYL